MMPNWRALALSGLLLGGAPFAAAKSPSAGLPSAGPPTAAFHAMEMHDADFARDFRLRDAEGKVRALADWRGKVVLLFFGYVQCPDVCPTTLLRAARAVRLLGEAGKQVQVLFVTLDPERDTPPVLKEYAPAFHPGFLGLYTTPEATKTLARDFRVFYRKRPGRTPGSYSIDHSVHSYVYDRQGRLRLSVDHAETAEALAEDLSRLLQGE